MSYIEQGIYKYIKKVFLAGMEELFNRRWLPFVLFTISAVALRSMSYINSVQHTMIATAFVLGALWSLINNYGREFAVMSGILLFYFSYTLNTIVETMLLQVYFMSWIFLINLLTFLILRDFISGWSGFALFLGNPKGRVVFRPVINTAIILFVSYILLKSGEIDNFSASIGLMIGALVLFVVNNLVKKQEGNEVFGTIMGIFSFNFIYHFIIAVNPHNYSVVIDLLIVIFGISFAAKNVALNISRKTNNKDFSILLTLGLLLGYHNVVVKTIKFVNPIAAYHSFSFLASAAILSGALFLFVYSKKFRNYITEAKNVKRIKRKILSRAGKFILDKLNAK